MWYHWTLLLLLEPPEFTTCHACQTFKPTWPQTSQTSLCSGSYKNTDDGKCKVCAAGKGVSLVLEIIQQFVEILNQLKYSIK
jgi:hypothetical protein